MDAVSLAYPLLIHSDNLMDTIESCMELRNIVDVGSSFKDSRKWSQIVQLALDTLLKIEIVVFDLHDIDSPDTLGLRQELDSISMGKLIPTLKDELEALQFIFEERKSIEDTTSSAGKVALLVLNSSCVEIRMRSVLEKLQLLSSIQLIEDTVRSEKIDRELEKITLEIKYSTLADSEKRLGFAHPDTLAIASDLGLALHRSKFYNAAEHMYRRVLAAQELVQGSASSLKSIYDLAKVLESQGKSEAAEKMFRRAAFRRQHLSDMERPSSGQLRWKVSNEGSLISDYIQSLISSPEAVEIGLSASAAAALSRRLQGAIAHKTRIAKFRAVSYRSRAQTLIESLLGVTLEWWPLPQPQHSLPAGLATIVWTCNCGAEQSIDARVSITDKIAAFCQQQKSDHADETEDPPPYLYKRILLRALGSLELILVTLLESLGIVFWYDVPMWVRKPDSSCSKKYALGHSQLSATNAIANTSSSSVNVGVVSPTSQQTASISTRITSVPTPAPTGNLAQGSGVQNRKPQGGPGSRNGLHVFISLKKGGHYVLAQWNTSIPPQNDKQFFQRLRLTYKSTRGPWRFYLGLERFSHCEFYRLKKLGMKTFVLLEKELPGSDQNKPPRPEHQVYHYMPKPADPNPPINAQEFYTHFYACSHNKADYSFWWHRCTHTPTVSNEALQSIPRRETPLDVNADQSEILWGLHIRENLSIVAIMAYNLLIMIPSIAFLFWWIFCSTNEDLSNGSVPGTLTLGGLALFWAIFSIIQRQEL